MHKYLLIDAAVVGYEMKELREANKNHLSLYLGKEAVYLDSVAPFLFQVSDNKLGEWFLKEAKNNPIGMIVESTLPFKDVHHHFRKFLIIQTEAGKKMYFRFYDPRVLPLFLQTSSDQQLKDFFGDIQSFMMVNEQSFTKFSLGNEGLIEEEIKA